MRSIRFLLLGVLLASLLLPITARAGTTCFGHEATITDGPEGNTIHGTGGDDVIVTRGGNDRIFARGGDDIVCAGPDNDRVRGGKGADQIGGGHGSDVPFTSNQRRDVLGGLLGNRGDDLIRGGEGIDRLQGGKGDDRLRGGPDSENDVSAVGIDSTGDGTGPARPAGFQYNASWAGMILGGGGSDRLWGEGDDDLLDARDDVEFNDRLNGGKGRRDRCRSDPDQEVRC